MSDIRPQVYINQNQGYVVDTWITRGSDEDVDVIFIDWSEICPENDGFNENQLDRLEEAAEMSLRLPKQHAIENLTEMIEFLETHFDADSGYVLDDDFSKRAIQTIKDLKSHITDLEMERK